MPGLAAFSRAASRAGRLRVRGLVETYLRDRRGPMRMGAAGLDPRHEQLPAQLGLGAVAGIGGVFAGNALASRYIHDRETRRAARNATSKQRAELNVLRQMLQRIEEMQREEVRARARMTYALGRSEAGQPALSEQAHRYNDNTYWDARAHEALE